MEAIRRRLEIPSGVFHHHLEKLLRSGLIEKRDTGVHTRVYPSATAPPPDAPALAHESAKAVALFVISRPGLSSAEIAAGTGRSQRTVQTYLRNLMEAGLIDQEQGWETPLYHPTAKLRREISARE